METVDAYYEGLALYLVLLQFVLHPWLSFALVSIVSKNLLVRELRKGFQTLIFLYALAIISMYFFSVGKWNAFGIAVTVLWFCKKVADAPNGRYS